VNLLVPRTQLLRGLALLAAGSAATAAAHLLLQVLGGALQVLEQLLDLGDALSQTEDGIRNGRNIGCGGGGNGGSRRHLLVLIYLVGVFLNRKINALFNYNSKRDVIGL
jgi:hypothetical protein